MWKWKRIGIRQRRSWNRFTPLPVILLTFIRELFVFVVNCGSSIHMNDIDMKLSIRTFGFAIGTFLLVASPLTAQQEEVSRTNTNVFRQLGTELPTANTYRTASGAPGHNYWQQQVDYDMKLKLDDATQRIDGSETITYTNNSPDELRYLWLQLDQNVRAKSSDSYKISESSWSDSESFKTVNKLEPSFDGGFNIEGVKDASGNPLSYTINKTMMRVDLPRVLKPGSQVKFSIDWWYNINNRMEIGGRSGYEYFEENDNYLVYSRTMAAW